MKKIKMNKEVKLKIKEYEMIESYLNSQLKIVKSLKNLLIERWEKIEVKK